MKLHIITVGAPKLAYAKQGWEEYTKRLGHYHQLRISHIADHKASAVALLQAIGTAYSVALCIEGTQMSSAELSLFLQKQELSAREVSFCIGGPEGLPEPVTTKADLQWSFGPLTYPHDLAMVMLSESLYRASSITAGLPYHK
jgi:23S rRNA (pseudouridine1915-N3)-methyltransferase